MVSPIIYPPSSIVYRPGIHRLGFNTCWYWGFISLMTLISFFNLRNPFSWYRKPIAVNEEARISATFTSNRGKDHTIAVSFVSDELNGVRGECTVLNVNWLAELSVRYMYLNSFLVKFQKYVAGACLQLRSYIRWGLLLAEIYISKTSGLIIGGNLICVEKFLMPTSHNIKHWLQTSRQKAFTDLRYFLVHN